MFVAFCRDLLVFGMNAKKECPAQYNYPNEKSCVGWEDLSVSEKIERCRIPRRTLVVMSDKQLKATNKG